MQNVTPPTAHQFRRSSVKYGLATAIAASTPLTVAAFALCAGTGTALLLGMHAHFVKELHEWSSVALLIAVTLHLVKHARPLAREFLRWPVWAALGGAAILAITAALILPEGQRRERERSGLPGSIDHARDE
jgi:hypothetical protein